MKSFNYFACLVIFLLAISSIPSTAQMNHGSDTVRPKLDTGKIEQITGMKGVEKNGEYKITVPQNDLNVVVDGFKIIPPMGLGSWANLTPSAHGAMLMGDIILTETDLKPVQQEVIRLGLTITAVSYNI
jgi:hypothetical protein